VRVLNKNPNDKEVRYCERIGLKILEAGIDDLLEAAGMEVPVTGWQDSVARQGAFQDHAHLA
jgi:hypothetical protein